MLWIIYSKPRLEIFKGSSLLSSVNNTYFFIICIQDLGDNYFTDTTVYDVFAMISPLIIHIKTSAGIPISAVNTKKFS
jgi:hypothetical protein